MKYVCKVYRLKTKGLGFSDRYPARTAKKIGRKIRFLILGQLWNTDFSILILIFLLISAIGPFSLTLLRSQFISYSHIIDNMHDKLVIKNPTDTFNFEAYTKPLRLWSWVFIGIFCVVCPPFLYVTTR